MKTPKAPKAHWGQGGKSSHLPSSIKKPKARGISPSGAAYGILNTSRGDQDSNGSKANKLFGISRTPKKAQTLLTSKVKRYT